MKKFKIIFTGICIVLLIMIIINFGMDWWIFDKLGNGSDDGWLGFWGGFLGAIFAVVGVWWQTNKTIENEKELMFSNARPFFNLTIERKVPKLENLYVCEKNSEIKVGRKNIYLKINNFSNKLMMKVVLKIYTENKKIDQINIGRIEGGKSIQIATSQFFDINNKNLNEKEFNEIKPDMKEIDVYFTTEKRERVKLSFRNIDGKIEGVDGEKIIESKAGKGNLNKLNNEYNKDEFFKESEIVELKK